MLTKLNSFLNETIFSEQSGSPVLGDHFEPELAQAIKNHTHMYFTPTNSLAQPTYPYLQLCVWRGTILSPSTKEDLENFFLMEMDTRIKYHAEVLTQPEVDAEGILIPGTGLRNDLFFYVHNDDIEHFAIARLRLGISWWEDVVKYNDNAHEYSLLFLAQNPVMW